MAEVRKTLKIDWYRCPIDKKVLSSLVQKSDAKGLLQAGGHFGLWVVTGATAFVLFNAGQWWWFLLALFLHGTVATYFTAPNHELCHRTVFKTPWINELFLRLFCLFGWLNFRIYRFSHNYHHRYTLFLEGDREEILPVTPSLRALYILQLFTFNIFGGYQSRGVIPTVRGFIDIALNRFSNPFNSWGEELYQGHDVHRQQAVKWARVVIAFHVGVAVFALVIDQPILILLISGSVFVANWHRYFVGVTMHCGLRSGVSDFRKCARSVTLDPISEFLYWHMNWHLEHHMFAAVPCYNLKELHRAVADDMPEPRTLLGAWREMRDTWRRQKIDPDYEFDTPVPEPGSDSTYSANSGSDPNAESVGDLIEAEIVAQSVKPV
ncbi:fatty acid desaturase [Chromatiales bacterium (ex Bugula neritina AB1)]|nr:fatty acid desaturase [Chromatiales bacterium (ex Bugula neritina AB1)]